MVFAQHHQPPLTQGQLPLRRERTDSMTLFQQRFILLRQI